MYRSAVFPLLTFLCLLGICLAVFNVISKYHRIHCTVLSAVQAEDLKQTLLCHLPSFENVFSNSAASIPSGHAARGQGHPACILYCGIRFCEVELNTPIFSKDFLKSIDQKMNVKTLAQYLASYFGDPGKYFF